MKSRLLIVLTTLGLAAAALANDIVVNAGRWVVTGEIQYGPKRPAGLPASEKIDDVHCLAKASGFDAKAPVPFAAEDCKILNFRKEGSTARFTAKCEEGTIDYVIDSTATTFKGNARYHGPDPSLVFNVQFEGRRTGPSCSAAELEKYGED